MPNKDRIKRIFLGVAIVQSLAVTLFSPNIYAERTIMVPPFENLSEYKAMTSYRANTGSGSDPSRSYTIDRYSEIPRNIIEDIIVNNGGRIVERQRIDAIMLEGSFVTMSGLVESSKTISIGRMLGANTIIQGSIVNIQIKEKSFSGYGVRRKTKTLSAALRIRAINIEKGAVIFSKSLEGQVITVKDDFSYTRYNDEIYDAIKSALEPLNDDINFLKLIEK